MPPFENGATLPVIAVAAAEPGSPCGLGGEECRMCAALPVHRRADWRASRLALKSAVAAALEIAEEDCSVAVPIGTPAMVAVRRTGGEYGPSPASTSVSHRDGRGAAVADAAGRRVGVDLERLDAVPAGTEHYFVAEAERVALRTFGAAALWSLKEASWKALGCDARVPFKALRLEFDDDDRLVSVALSGRSRPARAALSSPWPGYVLSAVVLEEAG